MTPLLQLRDLRVRFATPFGSVEAVAGIGLELAAGSSLAVVGESGSGKSQTWLACAGLLAAGGSASGSVRFDGQEVLNRPERELQRLRGPGIGFVFQDALGSLTPHLRVGEQLAEVLVAHRAVGHDTAMAEARRMLQRVQVPDAPARLAQYPHELSGGTRQRVAIAAALMPNPRLLVADEPTTGLDMTVQAQVVELFRQLRDESGMTLVTVSHDLGVVAGLADHLIVMYAGRVVEEGTARALFASPRHPYTAGLLAAVPRLDDPLDRPMRTITGVPPVRGARRVGCPFAPRCERRQLICDEAEPVLTGAPGRRVACHDPLTAGNP